MREGLIRLAFMAAVIWSAWILGNGWITVDNLQRDTSGEFAWQLTKSVMGDAGEDTHEAFIQQWSDPNYRQSWVSSFEATYWSERIKLWVFPILGIAALAFLAQLLPKREEQGRETK